MRFRGLDDVAVQGSDWSESQYQGLAIWSCKKLHFSYLSNNTPTVNVYCDVAELQVNEKAQHSYCSCSFASSSSRFMRCLRRPNWSGCKVFIATRATHRSTGPYVATPEIMIEIRGLATQDRRIFCSEWGMGNVCSGLHPLSLPWREI